MLDGSELYVIVKLVSGEQLMAVLESEDDDYVELGSPMSIKMVPVIQERKEHITANPFCQFSDDTNFVLSKRNVLFIKKMHHFFIPHYQRIVAEHERSVFVAKGNNGEIEESELDWDDEESLDSHSTIDEVAKKIKMLQTMLGQTPEEEENQEEERYRYYVSGNDTIN